jgi:hypothetical protein
MLLNWYQYFQILSLIVAIICLRGLSRFGIVVFIPLLFVTNICEIIGINYKAFGWDSNYVVYNLYLIATTPLYCIIYSRMLDLSTVGRTIFIVLCILVMTFVLLNFFFLQGLFPFNTYSLILIELMNIFFTGLCLIRLALKDDKHVVLRNEPFFWINTGILLFSLVTLVLLGLQQYIRENRIEVNRKSMYYALLPSANVVLYLGYSYAFILCQVQTNKRS